MRFRCPNPTCTFEFDTDQIPPTVTLLGCPLCHLQFPYQPPTSEPAPAVAPPPAAPQYNPSAPPANPYAAPASPQGYGAPSSPYEEEIPTAGAADPYAHPHQSAPTGYAEAPPNHYGHHHPDPYGGLANGGYQVPPAMGTPDYPTSESGDDGAVAGPLIRSAPPKTQGSILTSPMLITTIAFVIAVTAMVGWFMGDRLWFTGGGPRGPQDYSRWNFSFRHPGPDWVHHTESATRARKHLTANIFVLNREEPRAWVAMAAEDFKTHEPRESKIRESLRVRLERSEYDPNRGLFENLQSEEIPKATWAGRPAIGFFFNGNIDGDPMEGACFAMSYKGVAYWYFAWAPQGKFASMKDELLGIREGVKLLDKREKWQPKRTTTNEFYPEEGDYKVVDTEELWEKVDDDPKDYCEDATIVLRSKKNARRKRDYLAATAELLVREVPAQGDLLETARKAVLDRLQREAQEANVPGEITLREYEEPLQRDSRVPEIPSIRLEAGNSIDRNQKALYVVTAMRSGDKVIVAEARCEQWRFAEAWEPDLLNITGSLSTR